MNVECLVLVDFVYVIYVSRKFGIVMNLAFKWRVVWHERSHSALGFVNYLELGLPRRY